MAYYIATELSIPYAEAVEKTRAALAEEGFGVLTEIDVKATLKKKLGVDFRDYCILGACNPPFAHRALQAESKIGLLLPCNVVVQETGSGIVEVAAIDPVEAMQVVGKPELAPLAEEVRNKLRSVIKGL